MVLVRAGTGDPQGYTCCRDQELPKSQLESGASPGPGSVSAAQETRRLVGFHRALQGWALRACAPAVLRCSATKERTCLSRCHEMASEPRGIRIWSALPLDPTSSFGG